VLRDRRFHASWWDRHGDVREAARVIEAALRERGMAVPPERVEVLEPTFFRGQGAYVVGRIRARDEVMPLVLAVRHDRRGLSIGAVLTDEEDVSILFSYTRAAFVVGVPDPEAMVRFLRSLLPQRRVAELYSALGFGKHAKTELFRDLMSYIEATDDRFEYAPGMPGLVMIVFTMPGYDVVFKVIRDRFPPQKHTTPEEVRSKYRIVSRHDRAGRLIDAQEFEHLRFPSERFDPTLLDELVRDASRTVSIDGEEVVLHRAYLERRVTPLDVFLEVADEEHGRAVMVDYGTAIKNLAASNIFPGDMLIKNFGVTGRGRVVFYDYDELTLLTKCNFRTMPVSDDPYDDMADTPSFGVGENDIFPEEFRSFLGVGPDLRDAFESAHTDIYDAGYWRRIQDRLKSGEPIEIRPYSRKRLLVH
jgi:isocitrate dehydrogenase kinase/phosphatase